MLCMYFRLVKHRVNDWYGRQESECLEYEWIVWNWTFGRGNVETRQLHMPALDEGHKNVQSKGNNENTCTQPAGYYENTCTPGRRVAHRVEEMVGRTNKTSYNCYLLKDLETDGCLLIDVWFPTRFISTPYIQRLQYNYEQINSIISSSCQLLQSISCLVLDLWLCLIFSTI